MIENGGELEDEQPVSDRSKRDARTRYGQAAVDDKRGRCPARPWKMTTEP